MTFKWQKTATVELLNQMRKSTLVEHLDIKIEEIGEDFLLASMPVDQRTHQPLGILHGGASIALAETVGSLAANLAVDDSHYCVGLEVNGNHVRAIKQGRVYAKAKALHIGRSTHVWEIKIRDSTQRMICCSRLTMSVLAKGDNYPGVKSRQ